MIAADEPNAREALGLAPSCRDLSAQARSPNAMIGLLRLAGGRRPSAVVPPKRTQPNRRHFATFSRTPNRLAQFVLRLSAVELKKT